MTNFTDRTKNKPFAQSARFLPYYPELGVVVGGMMPSILMVQLEFLFALNNGQFEDGFFKYLDIPSGKDKAENPIDLPRTYKLGDSWCEWLGCSADVFQSAFKKIGEPYGSLTKFSKTCSEMQGDPFCGKLYMSVYDHKTNLTWYYRNHAKADAFIQNFNASLSQIPSKLSIPAIPDSDSGEGKISDPDRGKTKFDGKDGIPTPDKIKEVILVSEMTAEIKSGITAEGESALTLSGDSNTSDQNTSQQSRPLAKPGNLMDAAGQQSFPYSDAKTGIWIANAEDLLFATEMLEAHGEEIVQAASKQARSIHNRAWGSEVAKFLKQSGRGSKLTPGKWSDFDKKDYTKGSGTFENGYRF